MSNSLGEAVLDLTADNTPLKESVGDSKSFIESALGTLGGVAKGVLAAGIGVAAAAVGTLTGALGVCFAEAMEGQAVTAQLDAVLRSTGEAAAQQAQAWEDAQGKFVTSTALSSDELVGLQDELGRAQAKLNDMQTAWDKTDEHTEMAAIRLQDAKDKVAELTAAIESGGQTITTSLADSLGLVPPVAQMSKEALLDLADGLMQVTRFSDDAIIGGEAMLLTFTNIGEDVFPDATKTMLDMAQAMGTDLKSTSIQLGKALNSPKDGLTALTRVGVTFTDEQKKLVTALQDSGDMAGAQRVILAELQKEFGGSAEAAGKTFAGQLDILKNRILNVAEGIGTKLLPIGQNLLDRFILPALPAVEHLGEGVGAMIDALMGGEDIEGAFDVLAEFVNDVLPGSGESVREFGQKIQDVIDFVGTYLPLAISTLSTWWNTVLLPALQNFSVWVQTVLFPILTQLWTWLQTNLPIAISTLSTWWNTVLLPALQNFWTWVQTSLIPALSALWTWLQTNLPLAIQNLSAWFNNTFIPAVTGLVAAIVDNKDEILGFFTGLAVVVGAAAIVALPGLITGLVNGLIAYAAAALAAVAPTLATAAAWAAMLAPLVIIGALVAGLAAYFVHYGEKVLGANAETASFTDKLKVGFLATVMEAYNTLVMLGTIIQLVVIGTLNDAATTVQTAGAIIGIFVDGVLTDLTNIWDGIIDGIKGAVDWLQTMAEKLAAMVLPDWLTPGSPTPFENGLRGISSALEDVSKAQLPNFAASLQLEPVGIPSMAMAGAGAGAGGGNVFDIDILVEKINDELDITSVAYQVAEEIQRRQR